MPAKSRNGIPAYASIATKRGLCIVQSNAKSSCSIPSNIAEGCGRNHFKDSIQFFFIARGSLYEVETQVIIALDLGYISREDQVALQTKIKSCKRLLNGFINYFQKQTSDQHPSTINETLEEYKSNHEQLRTKN